MVSTYSRWHCVLLSGLFGLTLMLLVQEFRSIVTLRSARPAMFTQKPNASNLPPLIGLTIDQTSRGLESGLFTTVDLVRAYIARIEEASEFNAVLQVNPDAVDIAHQLDEERAQSGSRGPLHGVPLLVKDNIVTNDRLDASAGSYALLGAKPATESSLISKLRAAGVLILGKTNLSEWANFRGLNISSGWSPRGGQTYGTYYAGGNPEGSSAGSAVGVSLGLCIGALGTETTGSLVSPAEINNIVGFKPTRCLVGTDGVIPISARQDVVGTLTRTVQDAAYILSYMVGRSDLDERTWNIPADAITNFTSSCQSRDLSGIRIGVPRNAFDRNSPAPVMKAFEEALETLKSAGATVVDNANLPAAEDFKKLNRQIKGIVRASEFKRDIAKYLQSLRHNPNQLRTPEDIIEFTKTYELEAYPERDIGKFLWTQAEGIDVNSDKYKAMAEQERYYGGTGGILGAMQEHDVDVLATPSTFGFINDLAAKMGFPVMAVPLGFWPQDTPIVKEDTDGELVTVGPGIPFCLHLTGKAFSDHKLIQVGFAFEQLASVRENGPSPVKVPSTELVDVRLDGQKI